MGAHEGIITPVQPGDKITAQGKAEFIAKYPAKNAPQICVPGKPALLVRQVDQLNDHTSH